MRNMEQSSWNCDVYTDQTCCCLWAVVVERREKKKDEGDEDGGGEEDPKEIDGFWRGRSADKAKTSRLP